MIKWKPVGNKILVKCEGVEKISQGGIILPSVSSEREAMKQMYGTVVAVGPLAYKDQLDRTTGAQMDWVKVGDRVKFQQFAGHLHFEDGDKDTQYRLMHDLDILMVEGD